MHGLEVAPHLFDPMGTSNPAADWIGIKPDLSLLEDPPEEWVGRKEQCYCYKYTVADTQSPGLFLYHTHRHGTSTMLTWSGMFGVVMVGEPSATKAMAQAEAASLEEEAVLSPSLKPSLIHDLAAISRDEGLAFDDSNVQPYVIYDTSWRLARVPWDEAILNQPDLPDRTSDLTRDVILTDWWPAVRYTTYLHPYLVNGQFLPTIHARAGVLTLLRLACVSASKLCSFHIVTYEEGAPGEAGARRKAVPFYQVASDGISYKSPRWRDIQPDPQYYSACCGKSTAYAAAPDVCDEFDAAESPDTCGMEAYMTLGGGQREDLIVQFPKEGMYYVEQWSEAFDNGIKQSLGTINVTDDCGYCPDGCTPRDLRDYTLHSARPSVLDDDDRPIVRERGLMFMTQCVQEARVASYCARRDPVCAVNRYDQGKGPFAEYGIADYNGAVYKPYEIDRARMGLDGGTCELWKVRSPDTILHPFHIHVNPFQIVSVVSLFPKAEAVRTFLNDYTPPFLKQNQRGTWRDTVLVPPYGVVTMKLCFDAGVPRPHRPDTPAVPLVQSFIGKFVFHCHFLIHEDSGLLENVFLRTRAFVQPAIARRVNESRLTRLGTDGRCPCLSIPPDVAASMRPSLRSSLPPGYRVGVESDDVGAGRASARRRALFASLGQPSPPPSPPAPPPGCVVPEAALMARVSVHGYDRSCCLLL